MANINLSTHETNPNGVSQPQISPENREGCTRLMKDDESGSSTCDWRNSSTSWFSNVMLVCTDSYASTAIRYSLQTFSSINFEHIDSFSNASTRGLWHKTDIIILMPLTEAEERATFLIAATLYHKKPAVRMIVISANNGIMSKMSALWPFKHLTITDTLPKFKLTISFMLNSPTTPALQLNELLTPPQWNTLCLISDGLSLCRAASKLEVSVKTIHTHKCRAMARLGIKSRLHEAWIIEAIRELNHRA